MQKLLQKLKQIDGKGYKMYKSVQGCYTFTAFTLYIDYVQGDPFASPSKIRLVIPKQRRQIKSAWLKQRHTKTAVEDQFARAIGLAADKHAFHIKGSGKSGAILFDKPGQEVLERSAVQINETGMTICMSIGLPANGRRINGREAEKLFSNIIPVILEQSVFAITDHVLDEAVKLAEQQDAIRSEMARNGWISFIANGAILPRKSGVSNQPLENAVPFKSPKENEVTIQLPYQTQPITGMAVKQGITLIVGGGYHGKSTLLEAVERGVYPHPAGDGREFVLTNPDTVKIRAEDGRQITGVNISPFISNLPHKQNTDNFTTGNASGSTSQAANVMEALEIGATALLIDEDTSATNFMIRDERMQQLVLKEPITPFIDRVKQLYDDFEVSTILVMGGSGDYFSVADEVIMMDEYVPVCVTKQAQMIVKNLPVNRTSNTGRNPITITSRHMTQSSLQTQKGKRAKVQAKDLTKILMGNTEINFAAAEQLADPSQTRLIAAIIQYLDQKKALKDNPSFKDLLHQLERQMDKHGLAVFAPFPNQHPGDIARVRKYEIAHVFNRMRTLQVQQLDEI